MSEAVVRQERKKPEKLTKKDIIIENPMLWWPNGYGEQNLYTVSVNAILNGEVVDINGHDVMLLIEKKQLMDNL